MKKILVLTLILNLGFCSVGPSNANANANVECYQLRMSFSDTQGVAIVSELFECPEGLEIKTDGYTVSNGNNHGGDTYNNYNNNYYIYCDSALVPNVKATGTPAQGKK